MKKGLIFIISVLLISCTKLTPPAETETKPVADVAAKSEEIPTLKIDIADRACAQDSDCEHVGNQCSCSCGEGMNKAHVDKYKADLEVMCKDYKGTMCKVNCNGSVKCVEKVCTYN